MDAFGVERYDISKAKIIPKKALLYGLPGNPPRRVRVVGQAPGQNDHFVVVHKDEQIFVHRDRLKFLK